MAQVRGHQIVEDAGPLGQRRAVAAQPAGVGDERTRQEREGRGRGLIVGGHLLGAIDPALEAGDHVGAGARPGQKRAQGQALDALIPVEGVDVLEVRAAVIVAIGAVDDAEGLGPGQPVVGIDAGVAGQHRRVGHDPEELGATEAAERQVEEQLEGGGGLTVAEGRDVDDVERELVAREGRRELRQVGLDRARGDQDRELVGGERRIALEAGAQLGRDHLELADRRRAGQDAHPGRAHGRGGRRADHRRRRPHEGVVGPPREGGGRQVGGLVARGIAEAIVDVAVGQLGQRRQGVAARSTPALERDRLVGRHRAAATARPGDVAPVQRARRQRVHRHRAGLGEVGQRVEVHPLDVRRADHEHRRTRRRRIARAAPGHRQLRDRDRVWAGHPGQAEPGGVPDRAVPARHRGIEDGVGLEGVPAAPGLEPLRPVQRVLPGPIGELGRELDPARADAGLTVRRQVGPRRGQGRLRQHLAVGQDRGQDHLEAGLVERAQIGRVGGQRLGQQLLEEDRAVAGGDPGAGGDRVLDPAADHAARHRDQRRRERRRHRRDRGGQRAGQLLEAVALHDPQHQAVRLRRTRATRPGTSHHARAAPAAPQVSGPPIVA
jgi:hypothetical protein